MTTSVHEAVEYLPAAAAVIVVVGQLAVAAPVDAAPLLSSLNLSSLIFLMLIV